MIPKTEGIVIKSFDYRETSRIVTFFTKDYGKITGILKGIRKDHKKFGSNVDKFSVNDLVYYHYRRSDLHLISQCDLCQFFFTIRQDYKKSLAANYSLELIDAIMAQEEVNAEVYQLLLNFLSVLETAKDIDKLVYIFQIKILQLSGFSPHLDSCVKCDNRIMGRSRFSMTAGGLICSQCPTFETTFTFISKGAVSSILHIERSRWPHALRLGLTKAVRQELKFVLNNFLTHHLERYLKTSRYLMASR